LKSDEGAKSRRYFITTPRVSAKRATLGRGIATIPNPKGVVQLRRIPMPQSLAQIYLHLIWSTKNRIPFLKDERLRGEMHAYLAGACKNLDSPPLKLGGVEDHIHVACRLSRKISISDLVRALKRESSKWIKKQDASLGSFYWQEGYGAFSISPSHVAQLQHYIADQVNHHRQEDFKEEFRRLLKKYGVEYDEKYVWD
jgi:REP element-mobilizing transposase RayT